MQVRVAMLSVPEPLLRRTAGNFIVAVALIQCAYIARSFYVPVRHEAHRRMRSRQHSSMLMRFSIGQTPRERQIELKKLLDSVDTKLRGLETRYESKGENGTRRVKSKRDLSYALWQKLKYTQETGLCLSL
ncbi:BZ3500_MvSof-1268-A1-R1_Chr2-2g04867 [Microbotryum saponariae]|uniref:BZ3500_MvSof-1268-A1-R1_Chr2-2g04867 protein n=1 Tax=Microbotryum saponariae TaxID=289078 RepID=A0A2X0L4H8_9BASI|nr:BZ3500_MvSof-1268-A1-R1_Chr2-2g04867 [Microbotryum saponariae]SDA00359.1 BZ3501_MvSof-1269-A2-R1_Chr2-2g04541 [Microbotryum saponariae]